MFKRITPQTIADWGERIYIRFLELTKRFTSTQIMALLAIIVGVLAGLGTCLFELLLYGIKAGLTHWFPVEQSHFLFLFYPVIGIILAALLVKYVVKVNIWEGVTRVLYAMSRKNSYIASHNCWTSVVGGATTIGFGGSVGPEAPIVLTGAAIGSNISPQKIPSRTKSGIWLSRNASSGVSEMAMIGSNPRIVRATAAAVIEEMSSGTTVREVRSSIRISSTKTTPVIGALKMAARAAPAPQQSSRVVFL